MALNFDTSQAVIVAFIFTVIAVSVATMFLSCFGKRKDKKKGKKGKAPSPQPAPPPSTEVSPKKETKVAEKPSTEVNVAAEVDNKHEDFSAVQRETEILRPEIDEEASLQVSYTSQQDHTDEPESKEAKVKVPESGIDEPDEKQNSCEGSSSMLDDIEMTLANLKTETKEEVTKVQTHVQKTVENGENKAVSGTERALQEVTNKKEGIEKEFKNEATIQLNAAPTLSFAEKTVKEETKETVLSTSFTKAKEDTEDLSNVNVNSGVSKIEDVKVEIESKSSTTITSLSTENIVKNEEVRSADHANSALDKLSDKTESVKEQIQIKAAAIVEDVQETVKEKIGMSAENAKEDIDLKQKKLDQAETKVNQAESKINGSVHELEKTSNFFQDFASTAKTPSPKIPPKVSPKPSPKTSPKTISNKPDAIQKTLSLVSTKAKEEINSIEEPASPTSPTSPTQTKSQSRIPMSKKTSAIPKLSLSSPKSSSVSPLSSPDSSTAKKVDQNFIQKEGEKIVNEVKELAVKTAGSLTENNKEMDSKEKSPEPEKSSSPFERESRGSKSRLTKLRYSGRKPAETKSDESESERGSRAGSEAKSEDGKRAGSEAKSEDGKRAGSEAKSEDGKRAGSEAKSEVSEDVSDQDKSSRIPVRASSKPRSSPPKTLGV